MGEQPEDQKKCSLLPAKYIVLSGIWKEMGKGAWVLPYIGTNAVAVLCAGRDKWLQLGRGSFWARVIDISTYVSKNYRISSLSLCNQELILGVICWWQVDFVHIQVQARLPSLVLLTNLERKEGCLKRSLEKGAKSIWLWLEVEVILSLCCLNLVFYSNNRKKKKKPTQNNNKTNPANPTPLNKQHLKQFIKKDKYKEEKRSWQRRNMTQWLEGLSVPKKGEKNQCLFNLGVPCVQNYRTGATWAL